MCACMAASRYNRCQGHGEKTKTQASYSAHVGPAVIANPACDDWKKHDGEQAPPPPKPAPGQLWELDLTY